MSFINKALEKAKSLHQQKTKTPAPPRPEPRREPPPPPDWEEAADFAETPGEIHYTYTRKVGVEMDSLRQHRLIVSGSDDSVAEAYKLLRTQILHRTKEEGRNTLMFTGPLPDEGKTLTTINVAIAISQRVGQTVLLVEGDLRNPSMQRYLDLPSGPGLVDYLTSGYPIADSLVHPEGLADLVVLPAGKAVTNSVELLSSPVMVDLVKELKHFYPDRYVLFDLPPLLYADPLAFAPLVDGIILVIEVGSTPREEITRAVATLKEFPILGCVLNKVDPKILPYDYYYRYYPERYARGKSKRSWFK